MPREGRNGEEEEDDDDDVGHHICGEILKIFSSTTVWKGDWAPLKPLVDTTACNKHVKSDCYYGSVWNHVQLNSNAKHNCCGSYKESIPYEYVNS